MARRISMGIDSSTQSIKAIGIDIDSGEKVFEHTLDYRKDFLLGYLGIGQDYLIPPRVKGEADQPPKMYLMSLDTIFEDLNRKEAGLSDVVVINVSGQQHGHVYLNSDAENILARLNQQSEWGYEGQSASLAGVVNDGILGECFSYLTAPIWMTSNTSSQTVFVRNMVGGKENMIRLSGSDAPLRFTGTTIRRVGEQFPEAYMATDTIQLISSFIPAVLTGNSKVPIDFGNACGMTLMDYQKKEWSPELIAATAHGLLGGEKGLRAKLPELVHPTTIVGNIAQYFVERHGFDPRCKVVVGSGDNPQAKVMVAGDLLSLGTSFVNMVSTDGNAFDMEGLANGMYDGLGRPFMFGCRTNGAMVWDMVREQHHLGKEQYDPAEEALAKVNPGESMVIWQPKNESFPPSGIVPLTRFSHKIPDLGADYSGVIESSLAALYLHSKGFTTETSDPLYVTGGATSSEGVMRRVAGIWKRPVVPIEKGGPALGAAVAGAYAYLTSKDEPCDVEGLSEKLLKRSVQIDPVPEDVAAYHSRDGYLVRFAEMEKVALGEK